MPGHVQEHHCLPPRLAKAVVVGGIPRTFGRPGMDEQDIPANLAHWLVDVAEPDRPGLHHRRKARLVDAAGARELIGELAELFALKDVAEVAAEAAVAPPAPPDAGENSEGQKN